MVFIFPVASPKHWNWHFFEGSLKGATWAQLRFSCFMVLLGRVISSQQFDPSYAMLLQNLDELRIPLKSLAWERCRNSEQHSFKQIIVACCLLLISCWLFFENGEWRRDSSGMVTFTNSKTHFPLYITYKKIYIHNYTYIIYHISYTLHSQHFFVDVALIFFVHFSILAGMAGLPGCLPFPRPKISKMRLSRSPRSNSNLPRPLRDPGKFHQSSHF